MTTQKTLIDEIVKLLKIEFYDVVFKDRYNNKSALPLLEDFTREMLSKMSDESLQAVRIEKKEWIPESGKLEDHWGLTEAGINRTIENNKTLGFNQAVSEQNERIEKYLKDVDKYNE